MSMAGRLFNNRISVVAKFLAFVCVCLPIYMMSGVKVMAYDEVVVVIDPGHGGEVTEGKESSNAGAMYHDLLEKDINLITAFALKEELSSYENVTVYLTRETDVEMSLDQRVDFAKSVNADVLVSVHYNASADHNFFGSEAFVSAFGQCYARGYDLADCVMKRWEEYGNTLKDIKVRIGDSGKDYYGIIRLGQAVDIPTVILEHAYLDNDVDYLRIKSEEAWKELGRIDAKGIADYYGLRKDTVKAKVTPISKTKIPSETVMPDTTGPTGVKLTIDEYDSKSGDVKFTLNAYDDESKLMYYGFLLEAADEDAIFPELSLWDGENGKLTGTYHVKPGYEGPITATVFNVYQLNTNSNVTRLEAGKNAAIDDGEATDDIDAREEQLDDLDIESIGNGDKTGDDILDEYIDKAREAEESEEAEAVDVKEDDNSGRRGDIIIENDSGVSDEMLAKAIEDNVASNVKKSYNRMLLIGLVAAIVFAVSLVLFISSEINNKKRGKSRTRRSYDWMDDDD